MIRKLKILLRPTDGTGALARDPRFRDTTTVWAFHISKDARIKYDVPENLFQSSGNVVLADFRAVRQLAQKINERRADTGPAVRAGQLNAMGLIDEMLHYVFRLYELTINPGVLGKGLVSVSATQGADALHGTLTEFTRRFPPLSVHRGEAGAEEYLRGGTDGRKHAEVSLEELLMLHLANINPAARAFIELFDDAPLSGASAYAGVIADFRKTLRGEFPFGEKGESILDFLEAPMRAHPESLSAQLGYMRDRWGIILSPEFLTRILSSADLVREDEKTYPTGGAGPISAPVYPAPGSAPEYPETENFTSDTDWMPNIVLLAKNAYVWLHQLSGRYGRRISRLDEVPEDELERLQRWNLTSLWLIGVWERSSASEKIKRMTGNPEAAPSAYSLYDYEIAADLGGEPAFDNLARRAWQHGIRLAADMVPNHTGITSRWMKDHPDYFLHSDYIPFPSYRFTGMDLSDDPSYQVRIEDGYWTKSDAAVVFQHIDNATGRLRYLYHGNDGTNMPWNDTAQLDFLKREVREAVIGKIMHVARKFSVIRFDAAMTLTKKHFQRLWYPQPGTGGDIPSRADHALMHEEFNRMFPEEFWREVVDRINREMPQTLLLAEAFWLLEGYFVRTLGMHRVYNSAFMHMLMKEDNAQYREAIRSTLHYNPEILKRYVNFMSNPDEQTAIGQFGNGDKYFGVATLLVTLPGLPMIAHGQIEGYREKYGMEYRRSYHDESPDEELVRRHEREIFPLLGMRPLFSQTVNFELFDVVDRNGAVIEDIFAYSNMAGDRRAIVCYNNRYESHSGWIRRSVGKAAAGADADADPIRSRSLAEALGIGTAPDMFTIFRELRSGLEFIRAGSDFGGDGFPIHLGGYHCQVFLEFRQVRDPDGSFSRLCAELDGGGVPDLARAHRAMLLKPLHDALHEMFTPAVLEEVTAFLDVARKPGKAKTDLLDRKFAVVESALEAVSPSGERASYEVTGTTTDTTPAGSAAGRGPTRRELLLRRGLMDIGRVFRLLARKNRTGAGGDSTGIFDAVRLTKSRGTAEVILGWLVTDALLGREPLRPAGAENGHTTDADAGRGPTEDAFHDFLFTDALSGAFRSTIGEEFLAGRHALIVHVLMKGKVCLAAGEPGGWQASMYHFLRDATVREAIGVNEYNGVRYFHKESFSEILGYFIAISLYYGGRKTDFKGKEWTALKLEILERATKVHHLAGTLDYRYDGLMGFISAWKVPGGK